MFCKIKDAIEIVCKHAKGAFDTAENEPVTMFITQLSTDCGTLDCSSEAKVLDVRSDTSWWFVLGNIEADPCNPTYAGKLPDWNTQNFRAFLHRSDPAPHGRLAGTISELAK